MLYRLHKIVCLSETEELGRNNEGGWRTPGNMVFPLLWGWATLLFFLVWGWAPLFILGRGGAANSESDPCSKSSSHVTDEE